jgi:uncharacterized protein (TIGR02145 family)
MRKHSLHRLSLKQLMTAAVLVSAVLVLVQVILTNCRRFEPDQLVLLETGTVSGVTYHSCQVSGEIYDAGAGGLDQHGFVWSPEQDPQVEGGMKTEMGARNKTGSFSGTITGLEPATKYYIRAYGTSGHETSYGKEVEVTTSAPTVPVVSTAVVTGITDTTAISGGEVSEDGGAPVLVRGVCWDTGPEPDLQDSITVNGNGTGTFTSNLGHLSFGTSYYLRAYATNSVGTAFGEERSFTTGPRTPELAVVSTAEVTEITDTSVRCGGSVSDDGGSDIAAKGICWSVFQEPTVMDDTVRGASTAWEFSCALKGLDCNTTYYARAFVTNGVGTAYGEQVEFTTLACPVFPPQVGTDTAYEISDTAAWAGGTVMDDGGTPVMARGICWGTQPAPTTEGDHTEDGTGTGHFDSYLSVLEPATNYYYRAYAENSEGLVYGEEYSFKTLPASGTVADIDGNIYRTVKIGNQTWMAENLKTGHYADGTPIPFVEDQTTWGDLLQDDKAYCSYGFTAANMEALGALYTWTAAMNGAASSDLNPSGVQGACPDNWHLPSDAEWQEMEMALGMPASQADSLRWRGEGIGTMLKDTSNLWTTPLVADNASGFSALPGGHINVAGYAYNKTIDCYFWSSTDWGGDGEVWYRELWYDSSKVYRYTGLYPQEGYSVRCVKDD